MDVRMDTEAGSSRPNNSAEQKNISQHW